MAPHTHRVYAEEVHEEEKEQRGAVRDGAVLLRGQVDLDRRLGGDRGLLLDVRRDALRVFEALDELAVLRDVALCLGKALENT